MPIKNDVKVQILCVQVHTKVSRCIASYGENFLKRILTYLYFTKCNKINIGHRYWNGFGQKMTWWTFHKPACSKFHWSYVSYLINLDILVFEALFFLVIYFDTTGIFQKPFGISHCVDHFVMQKLGVATWNFRNFIILTPIVRVHSSTFSIAYHWILIYQILLEFLWQCVCWRFMYRQRFFIIIL